MVSWSEATIFDSMLECLAKVKIPAMKLALLHRRELTRYVPKGDM